LSLDPTIELGVFRGKKVKKVYLKVLFLLVITSYSYNGYAVDVNPKKASSLKSYEFGELVKSYMLNSSSITKWNYNTNSQNIVWDTDNLANSDSGYYKQGYIRINFNNYKLPESSYKNTKKVRAEAAWEIQYSGDSNKNVNQISLTNTGTAGMFSIAENERVQPFNSLIKQSITYKPVCLHRIFGGNYSIAYELSAANKKSAYLIQNAGEGSGGLSISYDIFHNKNDMYRYFIEYNDLDDRNSNCLI